MSPDQNNINNVNSLYNPGKRGLGVLKPLVKYIMKYKWRLMLVIIFMVISNLLQLAIPKFTGEIIDAIGLKNAHIDYSLMARYAVYIVAVALASFLFEWTRNKIMVITSQSLVYDLRNDVFNHLMHLPVAFFDKTTKGDIMSRVSVDVDNISETISSDMLTLLTGVVTIVGAFAMMAAISPILLLVFVVTIPMMFFTSRTIKRRTRVLFRNKKIHFANLCAHAEEMITSQKTVKVFGLENYNVNKFKDISEQLADSGQKAEFLSSTMMPSMNLINNLNFLFISIIGCVLFFANKITIGNISSFILYSKKFSSPIVEIANLFNTIQSSLAACERVFAILKEPVEEDTAAPEFNKEIKGNVCFENVSFSYIKDTPVIKDLSFVVKQGQKIAIVGSTGSGKTTLISLLLRFYNVDSGKITIDGIDIRDIPLAVLRKSFALVLQDSWLFEGSIKENIGYAADCTDSERIQQAIEDVKMGDYLSKQPDGLDTILSADTSELSQGQRQLLTIARAILYNPPFVIFDEATSSIDTKTEEKIKEVTGKVMEGKTSFIIAHRLSTIIGADIIMMIRNGTLCEIGSHQELMEKKGEYFQMYQSQFAQA